MPKIGKITRVTVNPKTEELTADIVLTAFITIDKSKAPAQILEKLRSGGSLKLTIKHDKVFIE